MTRGAVESCAAALTMQASQTHFKIRFFTFQSRTKTGKRVTIPRMAIYESWNPTSRHLPGFTRINKNADNMIALRGCVRRSIIRAMVNRVNMVTERLTEEEKPVTNA